MRDGKYGYELRVPRSWKPAAEAGGNRSFSGAGRRCIVVGTGAAPDLRDRDAAVAFGRDTAPDGAREVKAMPAKGANAAGVRVSFSLSRSRRGVQATFANAGSLVEILCAGPAAQVREALGVLPSVFPTVRLRRDGALERAQPGVLAVEGVRAAALRRDRSAEGLEIDTAVEVDDIENAPTALVAVLRSVHRDLPDSALSADAYQRSRPGRIVHASFDPDDKTGKAQILVPSERPRSVTIR